MMKQSSDTVRTSLNSIEGGVKRIEEGDDGLMNVATEINGSIYRINGQIEQFTV